MMCLKNVHLIQILFLVILNFAMAIKCYQCRTDLDDGCGNPNQNYLVECSKNVTKRYIKTYQPTARQKGGAIWCRKFVQTLYFMDPQQIITIRECAFNNDGEKCYSGKWDEAYVYVCDCAKEGCNVAAPCARFSLSFLLITVVLVLFPP